MLAGVADNHSHITDQGSFDVWRKTLELDNPDVFLAKLSGAIDQLIDDKWWVDREMLKNKMNND